MLESSVFNSFEQIQVSVGIMRTINRYIMIAFYFREAQCDVDQVLVDLKQPRHSKALYVRAEAMYNLGNFEYALMNFHRAKKKCRPKVILVCHRSLQKKYFYS